MKLSKVSTFEDALFNEDPCKSTQNSDILLKQYEVYVELMDRVYERRSKVNTFYLSLNSILLTGLAAFLSQAISPQTNYAWILVAVSAGIVFCIIWRRAILSSKALIVAKYKVIHLLETRLPARSFGVEWDIVKQGKHKYTPFSDIEGIIPLVFVGAYTVIAVLSLAQLLT
jgi:hypothetical protein